MRARAAGQGQGHIGLPQAGHVDLSLTEQDPGVGEVVHREAGAAANPRDLLGGEARVVDHEFEDRVIGREHEDRRLASKDVLHGLDVRGGHARIAAARPIDLDEGAHVHVGRLVSPERDGELVHGLPHRVDLALLQGLVLLGRILDEDDVQVHALGGGRRPRLGGQPPVAHHQGQVSWPLRDGHGHGATARERNHRRDRARCRRRRVPQPRIATAGSSLAARRAGAERRRSTAGLVKDPAQRFSVPVTCDNGGGRQKGRDHRFGDCGQSGHVPAKRTTFEVSRVFQAGKEMEKRRQNPGMMPNAVRSSGLGGGGRRASVRPGKAGRITYTPWCGWARRLSSLPKEGLVTVPMLRATVPETP